ncbi:MAG: hypothetical protein NW208_03685 [Bryobacter sp.]|nr:hypothetical protein [Bryobacter sp.]
MPVGANKKAIVYRFDREALPGFLDSVQPLTAEKVSLLSPEGALQEVSLSTIKTIAFVKDWAEPKPWHRPSFSVRPRQTGLWVRLEFRDGESVEATMANQLPAWEGNFFVVTPPDPAAGIQKVLVPKAALVSFEVLGVVGSPLKKRPPKTAPAGQLRMFD